MRNPSIRCVKLNISARYDGLHAPDWRVQDRNFPHKAHNEICLFRALDGGPDSERLPPSCPGVDAREEVGTMPAVLFRVAMDPEFPHAGAQGARVYVQDVRSAVFAFNPPLGLLEHADDMLAFQINKSLEV